MNLIPRSSSKILFGLGLAITSLAGHSAQAQIVITNGNFETGAPAANGNAANIASPWFDDLTANFFDGAWHTTAAGISPNNTAGVVFSSNGATTDPVGTLSWMYENIGDLEGETGATLQLSFLWGNPDDTAATRDIGLTLSLYESTGGFLGADGTDIEGAVGVTLIDRISITDQFVGAGDTATPTVSLNLAGVTSPTNALFLRINNFEPTAGDAGESWPYFDNLTATVVPEPSAAVMLLGGLGSLLGFRRSRHCA